MTTKQLHAKFQIAIEDADFAGLAAVEKLTVAPMYVGTPKNLIGSLTGGDDGGFDLDKPVYFVPDGVCGFASINLRAKDTEARKFLNWVQGKIKSEYPASAVKPDATGDPYKDNYLGGVTYWVGGFRQSLQKKECYASAFAKSLNAAGITGLTAWSQSRMD